MQTAIYIMLLALLGVLLGLVIYLIFVIKDLRRTIRKTELLVQELNNELPALLENVQASAAKTRWILEKIERNLASATGTVGILTKALRPRTRGLGANVLYSTLLGLVIGLVDLVDALLKKKKRRGGEQYAGGKNQQ